MKIQKSQASANLRILGIGLALIVVLNCGCREAVHVSGVVSQHVEDGPNIPIPGAIVTYTHTGEDGTTYSHTSFDPSGLYQIDLYEGTYTIQVVHPDYQLDPPVQNFTSIEDVDRYTRNLYMVPRSGP